MLGAISRALEERDQTQGHGARVAALAEPVARALGWDAERIAALRFGAPLHDIGKVALRREVLHKPGPLTVEERAEIRSHPTAGARLVLPLRSTRHALPYVLFHHGGGYPSGLRGAPFRSRRGSSPSQTLRRDDLGAPVPACAPRSTAPSARSATAPARSSTRRSRTRFSKCGPVPPRSRARAPR